ncbi:MAG: hypothetical protein QOJ50_2404 [Cryptosporangiaceae bacterium]|nr:hypothetical protein [Cryptosporangiaceae bacterium]
MPEDLYSPEQVAAQLGLHVRTVRNYVRDGRLKATRIGKQYRITGADLDAFTGAPQPASPAAGPTTDAPTAEVTSVVHADGISPALAHRISTLVLASAQAPRDGDGPLRVQTSHDPARGRLTLVVLGSPGSTAAVLRLVDALLEEETP